MTLCVMAHVCAYIYIYIYTHTHTHHMRTFFCNPEEPNIFMNPLRMPTPNSPEGSNHTETLKVQVPNTGFFLVQGIDFKLPKKQTILCTVN